MKHIKLGMYGEYIGDVRLPENYTGTVEDYQGNTKIWYSNGKIHREDGPAVEKTIYVPTPMKEYWVNGVRIEDEKAYNLFINMKKLKGLL